MNSENIMSINKSPCPEFKNTRIRRSRYGRVLPLVKNKENPSLGVITPEGEGHPLFLGI